MSEERIKGEDYYENFIKSNRDYNINNVYIKHCNSRR